jgi:hypothetical protein
MCRPDVLGFHRDLSSKTLPQPFPLNRKLSTDAETEMPVISTFRQIGREIAYAYKAHQYPTNARVPSNRPLNRFATCNKIP